MPAVVGQPAPDFSLRSTAGETVSLNDLKGSKAIIAFIPFPVLSDFWPHGATAQAYGCFNEQVGVAMRASYILDADGIVR